MDPITASAAIAAATQLIGGLFGASAQREQAKRQQQMQALATQFGMESQAQNVAQQQQQTALGNLIESYRGALVG